MYNQKSNHEKSTKGDDTVYENLNAEMARRKIPQYRLAEALGITPTTLSLKLQGKSDLSLKECMEIKAFLKTDISVDELFKTDDE